MFSSLMVTFREGIEAFLIVAISASYLRQTGRHSLLPPLAWGVVVAVIMSIFLGYQLFKLGGMTPFWEGTLALVAAVLVISCTVHMLKHGKKMKKEITGRLDDASVKPGIGAALAVFLFVLLMIGREGVETATMLSSLFVAGDAEELILGGLLGIACAAAMALAWTRYGHQVNLSRFFRVTAIFMVLFSMQLVIYAFHEFSEAGVLPGDNHYWHDISEPFGPEGLYGKWLSYSLVIIPGFYLFAAWLTEKIPAPYSPPASGCGHSSKAHLR